MHVSDWHFKCQRNKVPAMMASSMTPPTQAGELALQSSIVYLVKYEQGPLKTICYTTGVSQWRTSSKKRKGGISMIEYTL